MARSIVSVICGYLVMAVIVFGSFTVAYLAMGTERAFKPKSYDASTLWLVTSFVLAIAAAIVGGLVCRLIAGRPRPAKVLAGVVLVLGLLMALPVLSGRGAKPPSARTGAVGNFEAMQNAQQPPWVALLNPVVGAVGVRIGARLKSETAPRSEAA